MRRWSHDEQVSSRDPRPRVANGSGSPRRARLVLDGGLVDRHQDRVRGADAQLVGEEGRARQRRARRCADGRGDEAEGPREGEPRASTGQRDPAQGVCLFCDGGTRPPVQAMIAFIDDHRERMGSSRCASYCRSPRRPAMPVLPGASIPRGCLLGQDGAQP